MALPLRALCRGGERPSQGSAGAVQLLWKLVERLLLAAVGIDLPASSSLPQSGCGGGLQVVMESSFRKEPRHETLGGEGPLQRLEKFLLELGECSVARGDAGSRCLVTRHQ